MQYTSLHNHSHYSTLDGFQTIPEMVGRAKALGYPALSLTDHGTMRGIIDFYEECHKQGIKPIIGCEFYVCENPAIKDRSLTYHMVLLAMNSTGYYNLKKMDTIAYDESNFFFNARLPLSAIREYNEGVICLTACMGGVLNTGKADWWMQELKDIFCDRLYAEIQPLNIPEQQEYNGKVIELTRKYDVPLIVTTDAHYSVPSDQPYHTLWNEVKGYSYHDNENYLWSTDEILNTEWIPQETIKEAVRATEAVVERCNVEIDMSGNHYPTYPTENASELIRTICRKSWRAKVPKDKYREYAERFEAEMVDLEKVGYLNYLLVIWDMLQWCEKNNIPIGEGRGSAAGSLVGYLMGIHKIDPIQRGTEFFRFCNPMRVSAADIDSDVSTLHRGEVIDYVKERYGNICKVMTIGYTKNPEKSDVGKAAAQRAGQALKLEPQALRSLVKRLTFDLDEILECPEFDEETRKKLHDTAKHFAYRLDKTGIHASAILVTPDDIENYTPLEGCYSNDTSTGERTYIRAAAYTFHQLEAMGCLKLDILGLNTLDIMTECLNNVHMTADEIPMDDRMTYETYAKGNLMGVFQMESSGMQNVAKRLKVSNFNDIAALVALFRPGPIDSGMLQEYIDGKNGKEITYPCEAMRKIAGNTYGVLVYQEQIMKIAMEMAGYNLGQADMLRKVIGRKELTKIDQAVKEFIDTCVSRGYSEEVAKPVAEQIKAAGRYLFNKSHACSYAQLSYKTAYLKAHFPVDYMCAVINSKSKQEDVLKYFPELKKLGIKVLPPDYSLGNTDWKVENGNLRMGLSYIKGVGKALKLGYTDWTEFIAHNNKTICSNLIKAGAMDFLGKDRGWMIANLTDHQSKLARIAQCKERIEHYKSLGDKGAKMATQWEAKLSEVEMSNTADTQYDIAKHEMEVLGFSFHKLPKILTGTATTVVEFKDKKDRTMARIVFNTEYGEFKCVVFASMWKQKSAWVKGKGRVPGIVVEQGKDYQFMIENGILVDVKAMQDV